MPFFTVLLYSFIQQYMALLFSIAKSGENNATLQVRAPFIRHNHFRRKRVCLFSSVRQWAKGSMSVEAALGLSLFLFACICMMMPMVMMDRQRQIQAGLEKTGEQLSQYAYLTDEETLGIYRGTALGKLRILEEMNKEGIEQATFRDSQIMQDGETIKLVMNYKMRLPFSVFGLKALPMKSVSIRRAWIGRNGPLGHLQNGTGGIKPQQDMVFIGKDSTRYHKTPKCHYLSNEMELIAYEELETKRNHSGRKYRPCKICGKLAGQNSSVYVMPEGESYHFRWNCPATKAYIQEVPIEEAEHLGKCSYCW